MIVATAKASRPTIKVHVKISCYFKLYFLEPCSYFYDPDSRPRGYKNSHTFSLRKVVSAVKAAADRWH